MKYGLISDIHGNLEALTAVLRDIEKQKVDSVHCLGDVVGYGADPARCLKMVKKQCDTVLMGNHDYAAIGVQPYDSFNRAAQAATEWTRQVLDDKSMAIIADFEMERSLDDMYLVHASPYEPEEWHYILTENDADEAFSHLSQNIGFFGHSHIPTIIQEKSDGTTRMQAGHDVSPDRERRYLINIGSVGQPRDNDPRACYVIFDSDEYEIEFHRVEYDIENAQRKMSEARLPSNLISRLSAGT